MHTISISTNFPKVFYIEPPTQFFSLPAQFLFIVQSKSFHVHVYSNVAVLPDFLPNPIIIGPILASHVNYFDFGHFSFCYISDTALSIFSFYQLNNRFLNARSLERSILTRFCHLLGKYLQMLIRSVIVFFSEWFP